MGAGWLNLCSLALGLAAWTLPVVNLLYPRKADNRLWPVFTAGSLSACAVSLCLQLFYSAHLADIEDWSAIMDTSWAVAKVGAFLLIVTLALNLAVLVVYRRAWGR